MNSRKNWLTVLAVVIAAAGLLMVVLASQSLGEALTVPDPEPIIEVTQEPTPEPLPEPAQIKAETVEKPEAEQIPVEPEIVAESQPQPATTTESAQEPAEPEPETIVDEPDPEPIEAEPAPAPEPEQEPEPEPTPEPAPAMHLFDRCRVTHYCPCAQCCGAVGQPTASGVMPQVGHTVANNVLPYGTRVMINGTEYVVEDCGGSDMADGRTFDIFVSDHQTALNLGMYYADVYIIDE